MLIISPNFGPTFNFFFIQKLGFSPQTMGEISFVSSLAYFIGILSLNTIFWGVNFWSFYLTTSAINSLMSLSSLILIFGINWDYGISDEFFCLSNSGVQTFISEINFLPILAMCVKYCPKHLEATTYAVFTSIFNLAGYLSSLLGSLFVIYFQVQKSDFQNLWILILIQTGFTILVTTMLFVIRFPKDHKTKIEMDEQDNSIL